MRDRSLLAIMLTSMAILACSGCAARLVGATATSSAALQLIAAGQEPLDPQVALASDSDSSQPAEPPGDFATATDDRPPSAGSQFDSEPAVDDEAPAEPSERYVARSASREASESPPTVVRLFADRIESGQVELAQQTWSPDDGPPELDAAAQPEEIEEIFTPQPLPPSRFRPGKPEQEVDRFQRQVVDVPVDIRPTEGLMPDDVAAKEFADQPVIDETLPSNLPPDIFCSYTPWTICYRPLYFEDIALERYGCNVGCLQSGLSGVRFFSSVAALPYKMTRRPPRSCQCSNGFSRCGDCPLPGYAVRKFEWDAALMEAAAITAFAFIIP